MAGSALRSSHLQPATQYNHHLLPDTDQHLSLTLDLSLGGLFSYHNAGNFHLNPLQGSLRSSDQTVINTCTTDLDRPSTVDASALPMNCAYEPPDLLRTKSSLQGYEARKRRRPIIEGKLHKIRAKTEQFHERDELTRTSDAEYFEFVTSGCDQDGKESKVRLLPDDEAGKTDHGMNHISYLPAPSGLESRTVDASHVQFIPAVPMVDYMNVSRSEKDVPTSMNHVFASEVSCHVAPVVPSEVVKGDVLANVKHGIDVHQQPSLSCTSSGYSQLTSCTPCAATSQIEESNAVLSNFQRAPSTPFWHAGNAHGFQVAMPTCGSSSCQLQSWRAGEMPDSKQNAGNGDNNEGVDWSCNSSSSEVENECVNEDEQSYHEYPMDIQKRRYNLEENHVNAPEQAQASVTIPRIMSAMAYPQTFPLMPFPYPYGIPLPWGFPLPWFIQGSAQYADPFGVAASASPSSMVVQNEALAAATIPFGGFLNPYHIPVLGSNLRPWLPAPAGPSSTGGTCTALIENAIPAQPSDINTCKSPSLNAGNNGQHTSETVQNTPPMPAPSSVVEDDIDGLSRVLSQVHEDNLNPGQVAAYEPMREADTVSSTQTLLAPKQSDKQPEQESTSAGNSSGMLVGRLCKGQSKRGLQAPCEMYVAEGRQQSVPVQTTSSLKKRKVVRFNSLNVEAPVHSVVVRMKSDAHQLADGNSHTISPEQSPADAPLTCNQKDVRLLPDIIEHFQSNEMGPGSCGDGRQSPKFSEEDPSILKDCRAGDGYSADNDIIHSDKTFNADGKMDEEEYVGETGEKDTASCNTSDLKGGGTSRYLQLANLPRVSTRGLGPNGKMIHGVMYVSKGKQARLICVCHGKHMSPLEFVQHSGSSDLSNPERRIVLEAFPYIVDQEISVPAI